MSTGEEPADGAGAAPGRTIREAKTVFHPSDALSAPTPAAAGDGTPPAEVATVDELWRAALEIGLIEDAELEAICCRFSRRCSGPSRR